MRGINEKWLKRYKKEYKFKIVEETKDYITFKVPRKFSVGAFLLLILFLNIFGAVGYIIYYYCRADWTEKTFKKKIKEVNKK